MNALPQPKTHQIAHRINALQAASARFIGPSEITPLSRGWNAIRHDIDQFMRADACAAWKLAGSRRALAGDVEGAESALRNSVALGRTGVNRENWMITRLNLGLFSEAKALFRELADRRTADVAALARYGFLAGAIGRTAALIEEARGMGVGLDEAAMNRGFEPSAAAPTTAHSTRRMRFIGACRFQALPATRVAVTSNSSHHCVIR